MNTKFYLHTLVFAAISCFNTARADDNLETLKKAVVTSYAAIAGHTFADAHAKAIDLKEAIAAFSKAPSAELQTKAQEAWQIARLPYLQSEIFRPSTPAGKPSGFEAIEFLLWGEDKSVDSPGQRSFEDFIPAKNPEAIRHLDALNANAVQIVGELAKHAEDWKIGGTDTAATKFTTQPVDQSLGQIFTNVAAVTERLHKERIGKAYESRDEKDESSNFSDTTHLDLIYSGSGLANIVAGAYVGSDKEPKVQGSGLVQLAAKLGEEQGEAMKLAINRLMLAVTSFLPPFDRALLAPDDSPAREAIKEMMDALEEFSTETGKTAAALGLAPAAATESE